MTGNWWIFYVPGSEWDNPDYVSTVQNTDSWWTCHELTRKDDYALLYAIAPISAIVAILRVTKDAWQEANEYSVYPWRCHVRCEAVVDEPLTIRKIKADSELAANWGLVRGNFQPPGGAPPQIDDITLRMLARHIPELQIMLARRWSSDGA